jgi:hypothetical protein
VIRAIVVGVVVNTAAEPALAVCVANLKIWPAIPWSVPLAAGYLWFYWRYLRGRWWPGSTTDARRRDLRAHPLSARLWRWSLLAGGLAMASLFALAWVVGRFVPLGYALPEPLREVPPFLPGIVLHAVGDAVGIGILWWTSLHVSSGGARMPVPAWSDSLFWVQVLETGVLGIGAVWAFRRLALAARTEAT